VQVFGDPILVCINTGSFAEKLQKVPDDKVKLYVTATARRLSYSVAPAVAAVQKDHSGCHGLMYVSHQSARIFLGVQAALIA